MESGRNPKQHYRGCDDSAAGSGYPPSGPKLDITVQLHNLTLTNQAVITASATQPYNNLTVLGETTDDYTHVGGVISNSGGVFSLGFFVNDPDCPCWLDLPMAVSNGGVTQWSGADLYRISNYLYMSGPNSRLQRQEDGFNALTHLSETLGTLVFVNGYNFTTVNDIPPGGGAGSDGSFGVNGYSGLLQIGQASDTNPTTFTVVGNLTNFDASTKTLNGNYIIDGRGRTATLRFSNANVQVLNNANLALYGDWHITDLNGNDAMGTLATVQNGSQFSSPNGQTITPNGGTFLNDSSSHIILNDAHVTINGNYHLTNNGQLTVSHPSSGSTTSNLYLGGALTADHGAKMDMGGQPGVNTDYTGTVLTVQNGIVYSNSAALTGVGTRLRATLFYQWFSTSARRNGRRAHNAECCEGEEHASQIRGGRGGCDYH